MSAFDPKRTLGRLASYSSCLNYEALENYACVTSAIALDF
jgi:hypothetical protein